MKEEMLPIHLVDYRLQENIRNNFMPVNSTTHIKWTISLKDMSIEKH